MKFTLEPIVSSDIIDNPNSSIIDGFEIMVLNNSQGCFVNIVSWYDNEWMYSCRCADIFCSLSNYL